MIRRARATLEVLESQHQHGQDQSDLFAPVEQDPAPAHQASSEALASDIRSLDLDALSPRQAWEWLVQCQEKLRP